MNNNFLSKTIWTIYVFTASTRYCESNIEVSCIVYSDIMRKTTDKAMAPPRVRRSRLRKKNLNTKLRWKNLPATSLSCGN